MVVVDRGERATHIEDTLGQVDVVPVQTEGLSFAQAGADEELEQVGHVGVCLVAVLEEADGLVRGPDPSLGRRWPVKCRGTGGVVGEAMLADRVTESTGEGGQAAVEGGLAAACGELAGDERGDVPVSELVQLQGPEGGDEVVVDVVPVARHGGRLEHERLGGQPGTQVVGDGLVRIGVESAGLALQESAECGLGRVLAVEAASAHRRPLVAWGRDVDGEGPRPMVAVGEQVRAVRSELVTVGVPAATPAVDATAVGGGTHWDRLQETKEGPAPPVSCEHMRPPRSSHRP
ncbi:hypothetical protein [Streptomyces sp. KS 21]|uniref:hypothetical protein n=1 Tax=Streptomyces sp. KS 21 TaxID=2485150 RepID=UPI001FB87987|nr:hypothetical protein [Streptomyces sp. KS 21]